MTAASDEIRSHHHETPDRASRPLRRWLIPALVVAGAIAAVLVVSGVVSANVVVWAAVLGGCGLMHLFGHGGHGNHGGHGGRRGSGDER